MVTITQTFIFSFQKTNDRVLNAGIELAIHKQRLGLVALPSSNNVILYFDGVQFFIFLSYKNKALLLAWIVLILF